MQTRRLGSRGPELSVVGYGAWEAGAGASGAGAARADRRGDPLRARHRHQLDRHRRGLRRRPVRGAGRGRDHRPSGRGPAGNEGRAAVRRERLPSRAVRRACIDSSRRLRTGTSTCISSIGPTTPACRSRDTWGEMAALADEGLVRAIGVSNFDRALIERCRVVRHVDSLQQEFSMLRLSDREVIAWCRTNGTGVLSYGPLAYGLLTGAIGPDTRSTTPTSARGRASGTCGRHVFAPGRIERSLAVVAMRSIADRLGCTPGQLALAWTCTSPG